ncbi:MAG: hypothetical protein LBU69_03950 [Deltaproteobacteria bacterium]|nr:hypothetical protein [Deltaproteobacteria bacterium]
MKGPLLLVAILVIIGLAFFLLYKAGQHKLKMMRPAGQAQFVILSAKSQLARPDLFPRF